jgi:hypothetical protein
MTAKLCGLKTRVRYSSQRLDSGLYCYNPWIQGSGNNWIQLGERKYRIYALLLYVELEPIGLPILAAKGMIIRLSRLRIYWSSSSADENGPATYQCTRTCATEAILPDLQDTYTFEFMLQSYTRNMCVAICMYVCMYVCVCTHACVCMYICMYVYVCLFVCFLPYDTKWRRHEPERVGQEG